MEPDETTTAPVAPRRERLVHFDYFRGITILLVVASHSYGAWRRDSVPEIVAANLVTGATALFVFISGFFFHYAFHRSFDYGRFMRKKVLAVYVPYLVLTLACFATMVALRGEISFPLELPGGPWAENVEAGFINILTGRSLTAYWYVPFIMVMFLLSPLFLRFIEARPWTRVGLVLGFLVLAAFVGRPTLNLNPLHNGLYLVGFYLLGISYSMHRTRVDGWIRRVPVPVLWGGVLVVALGSGLAGQVGNLHKTFPWEASPLDWMVPLKLVTIAALLATCLAIAQLSLGALTYLAECSFALFFIHPWLILPVGSVLPASIADDATGAVVGFVVILAVSLAAIQVVKRVLGDRSRWVIGY